MTAKLIVTSGANRGAQFALADRIIFNIGSDRGSTVFLDDPKVSPNHCRLYKEDTKFTLFDVSGKGLAVNGKKVVKAVLAEGDLVQIGDTEIRFTMTEAPQPAYAGAVPGAAPAVPGSAGPAQPGAGSGRGEMMGASPAAPSEGHSVGASPGEPRGYTRIWLQCVEGNDKGKTFDLSEGNVWVVGRGHSADITVMDIKVSRAHCRIDRQGNTFYLNDLNSTNGTFLNGQQIDRQVLQRGDYVKVGYTILSFQYEEIPEPVAVPAPEMYAPPPPLPPPWGTPAPAVPAWGTPPPPVRPGPPWGAPPPPAPVRAEPPWGAPPPPAPVRPEPAWAAAGQAHPEGLASEGADVEADYRYKQVLGYEEVESRADDLDRLAGISSAKPPPLMGDPALAAPPALSQDTRKWPGVMPHQASTASAPPPPARMEDEDVPLDMAALDEDELTEVQPSPAPLAGAPAAWAPPPPPATAGGPPRFEPRAATPMPRPLPAPEPWGPPLAAAELPRAPAAPGAWGASEPPLPAPPPGAWGGAFAEAEYQRTETAPVPPPPQRPSAAQRTAQISAWGEPQAAPPPAWGPAEPPPAPPQHPGVPPHPGARQPRDKIRTGDIMVPDLDDDDLFGENAGAPAAEQPWGSPSPAWGPAAGGRPALPPPPQRPAAPGAPAADGRTRHKTGELPVSDYLVRGGPAPPPISSEANAPLSCFLCHRPFTQEDMRQNRLRRIKDHYYCLHCVQDV